jgi:cold shock CspA family protein
VARGTIKRLLPDRRFGFITANGRDYYFDEDTLQGAAFEELAEGADVLFEPAVDVHDEGPRAERVRLARDEILPAEEPDELT